MFDFSCEIFVRYPHYGRNEEILDFLGVTFAKHGNNFSVCYKESVLLNAAKKLVLEKIKKILFEEMFKMFDFSCEIFVRYPHYGRNEEILDFLGVTFAKHGNNFSVCYKESVLLKAAKKLVLARITIFSLKKCSKCLIFMRNVAR
jgi:hypothetical protein